VSVRAQILIGACSLSPHLIVEQQHPTFDPGPPHHGANLATRNRNVRHFWGFSGQTKGTDTMTPSTTFLVALALILATILAVAGINKYNSLANAAALPFSAKLGSETPVRATKGDRLHVSPEIRKIAGVTVVLRDFDRTIR